MKRLALGVLLVCCSNMLDAAEYRAGVGRTIITPKTPMRLAGFAARTHASDGVLQDLWAKAVAIDDGHGGRIVIVTADLIGIPRKIADEVASRLKQRHGLDRSQVLFNASHTHCGPEIGAAPGMRPSALSESQSYRERLTDSLTQVAEQAMASLAPAEVSFGRGSVGFAFNRRRPTPKGFVFGINPDGPVDHDVPVIKIATPDGKLRAVLFGYSCHNTTLTSNWYKFCGDYAGFAQADLEKAYPGATAMFVQLCGADQNANPRGTLERVTTYGRALAEEVRRVLATDLQPVSGPIRASYRLVKLDFSPQPRERFVDEAKTGDRYHQARAQRMLDAIDAGRPIRQIDCPVHAVRWGRRLALLAIGGEVVADYGLRLKRENPDENLIVAGYSNDVVCYIPSLRILREGGYEPVDSMVYMGLPGPFAESIEETLVAACRDGLRETATTESSK
ncbi:MAG: neutral/alkaline non-lysosomal ceramidase N-terminal domain-containing protein [Thermoguttaceae bacterium]